jgi:hypothetical protein
MKLLFSGHFDTRKQPERIRFLTAIQGHLDGARFAIFNQSGVCEAPFEVCNVSDARALDRFPRRALKRLLDETVSQPAASRGYRSAIGSDLRASRLLWEVLAENQITYYTGDAPVRTFLRKLREFVSFIDTVRPDAAFLWNSFNVFHRMVREILQQRGIPVYYFHDGVLPGSVAFDFDGEMGESWVARDPQRLLSIPVGAADRQRAETFVAFIRENSINRHRQEPLIDFKAHLAAKGVAHKPMILLAGQQDWHAGLLPDNPNRPLHSPVFASSTDALAALDTVAGEIGAHVLYKPHPLDRDKFAFLKKDRYKNVDIIGNGSIEQMIDHAAVTVTIASQASYTAAFRERPCALLGRNQMSFKGIAEDLASINDLRPCLQRAMAGSGAERREALFRHMAQLDKAYLYDFGTIEHNFYTRGAAEAARDLAAQFSRPAPSAVPVRDAGRRPGVRGEDAVVAAAAPMRGL